jgi:deoxyribodipyrimidine photo-lyase
MPKTVLWWIREDFRLADNPALHHAALAGKVLPVYIFDTTAARPLGEASKAWLHRSLMEIKAQLAARGIPILFRKGNPKHILVETIKNSGASAVFWNRIYESDRLKADDEIQSELKDQGIQSFAYNGSLLFEPNQILSKSGTPYRVFTPFSKACKANEIDIPLPIPKNIGAAEPLRSENPKAWNLSPAKPDWSALFWKTWKVGEEEGRKRLASFLDTNAKSYETNRDIPSIHGTSGLSPYLRWGQISPRQIWNAARFQSDMSPNNGIDRFLNELLWREFSHHLLFHYPDMPRAPLRTSFSTFPWRKDQEGLEVWQKGKTGYPLVDAGMRQLWQSGWMHNRVRMIVASFLVKHLLVPWQKGEAWFWDTLLDADSANNAASWQWVAGCGSDAAPFFRIFNPITQSQRFDTNGDYIRRYVPELAKLDAKYIHAPWLAPQEDLAKANIVLGKNYPLPIVDHAMARTRALQVHRRFSRG